MNFQLPLAVRVLAPRVHLQRDDENITKLQQTSAATKAALQQNAPFVCASPRPTRTGGHGHQLTVMNGQPVRPERELSIGRCASSVERVPDGDVR